jgi:hypothetical protein
LVVLGIAGHYVLFRLLRAKERIIKITASKLSQSTEHIRVNLSLRKYEICVHQDFLQYMDKGSTREGLRMLGRGKERDYGAISMNNTASYRLNKWLLYNC